MAYRKLSVTDTQTKRKKSVRIAKVEMEKKTRKSTQPEFSAASLEYPCMLISTGENGSMCVTRAGKSIKKIGTKTFSQLNENV